MRSLRIIGVGNYTPVACLLIVGMVGFLRTEEPKKTLAQQKESVQDTIRPGDNGRTILEKAVIAYGGAEKLSRWNKGYIKYKTEGSFSPLKNADATLEDTFQLPGHFKRVTRTKVADREFSLVFVLNKGKGWTKRGDAEAQPMENDFTDKTEHPFAAFCNVVPLLKDDTKLEVLGEEKVGERNTRIVRARSDKLGEVDLYFDQQTALLRKSKKPVAGQDPDKKVFAETFLDQYQEVQGGQVPMRIKGYQGGKLILDVTVIEVKFLDKVEEKEFAKP